MWLHTKGRNWVLFTRTHYCHIEWTLLVPKISNAEFLAVNNDMQNLCCWKRFTKISFCDKKLMNLKISFLTPNAALVFYSLKDKTTQIWKSWCTALFIWKKTPEDICRFVSKYLFASSLFASIYLLKFHIAQILRSLEQSPWITVRQITISWVSDPWTIPK